VKPNSKGHFPTETIWVKRGRQTKKQIRVRDTLRVQFKHKHKTYLGCEIDMFIRVFKCKTCCCNTNSGPFTFSSTANVKMKKSCWGKSCYIFHGIIDAVSRVALAAIQGVLSANLFAKFRDCFGCANKPNGADREQHQLCHKLAKNMPSRLKEQFPIQAPDPDGISKTMRCAMSPMQKKPRV